MKKLTTLLLSISALCSTAAQAQVKPESWPDYLPSFEGTVKARFETSTYDGQFRFNVRNARLGLFGNAGERVYYKFQVDFSNEGMTTVLDAYAGYKVGNFNLMIGQLPYHFSSDVLRSPNVSMFANRSFIAKYISGFYGENLDDGRVSGFVGGIGGRDIGANFSYAFKLGIPVKATFSLLNGAGVNNPQWQSNMNFMGRLDFTLSKKLSAGVSYYNGSTALHSHVRTVVLTGEQIAVMARNHIEMLDAELSFKSGNFTLDAEYAQRMLKENTRHMMTAAHVFGSYKFMLKNSKFAQFIMPVARWDIGDNIDYLNKTSYMRESFSSNRITAGVTIGLPGAIVKSELRFQYEKYFLKDTPSDLSINKLLQDKFTVEVVVAF